MKPTFFLFSFLLSTKNKKKEGVRYREVCVTVGLSSEVCLLPTTNEICDFWLFTKNKKKEGVRYREVCVTVGLSSEVCLLPTTNEICDFWLFLG